MKAAKQVFARERGGSVGHECRFNRARLVNALVMPQEIAMNHDLARLRVSRGARIGGRTQGSSG